MNKFNCHLNIKKSRICNSEMSAPNLEEVNTSLTGDETHSLGSNEVEDVGNATTGSSIPLTSEEVARQIKAATGPLTKQLKTLCGQMREL